MNNSVVLTICARGGSKGVPGKNIRPILGKPLIGYTIEQAKALNWIDRIVVSTDSKEIKKIAEDFGLEVPFLRQAELATDTAGKLPAIIHAVLAAEKHWEENYDIVLDLDPTSPLRNLDDINEVLRILAEEPGVKSVFSVCETYKNPYFNMVEENKNGYVRLSKKPPKPILRRQDAPKVYEMNASIYAMWKKDLLLEKTFFTDRTKVYVMPRERSVDIDNQIDFEFVEFLMKRAKG
jgi:CMP-N-acetylneuraminic acid synthetase